jgi:hypothetical protein
VRVAVGLALVMASAAIGCGGESERDQVLETVRSFAEAMDRGDRDTECRLRTPGARRRVVATVRKVQDTKDFIVPRDSVPRTCTEALAVIGRRPRDPTLTAERGAFANLDDASVAVRDGRAAVTGLRLPILSESELRLVEVDGRWRVDTDTL